MAKSNFTKLTTADSLISAHINGVAKAVNRTEETLGYKTDSKIDYVLTGVADQENEELHYRIYECDINSWVGTPEPVVKRNGEVVPPEEYVAYPGHGAIVFHIQQEPADVITADFTHLTNESQLADQVDTNTQNIATNTQDIADLQASGGGGGGSSIPFPIYPIGQYKTAGIFGTTNWRGADGTGVEQEAYSMSAFPLLIPETMTFDRLGTNVIQAGGGRFHFYIYDDNNGYPGNLVVGADLVSAGGLRTHQTPFTLEPGLYWIGMTTDGSHKVQGLKSESLITIGTEWNPANNLFGIMSTGVLWSSTIRDPFPAGLSFKAKEDWEELPAVFVRRMA